MSSLQGKVVIVTGSGGGIGRATAEAYLEAGANVVVCDINMERLVDVQNELSDRFGDKRILIVHADVTDEESVKSLMANATAHFGGLDMVVNNAGIMDQFEPAGMVDRTTWDRVMAVNLTGPFLITKHAVQRFEALGKGGTIINIGSSGSHHGMMGGAAFTASQHGLIGLTKNTAGFYGRKGIWCIALLPGATEHTNWLDAFEGSYSRDSLMYAQSLCPGYIANETNLVPKTVAKYVLFLSDDDVARGATGSSIVFNKNWPVK